MPKLEAARVIRIISFDDEVGGGGNNVWFGRVYLYIGDWIVKDELMVYGDLEGSSGRKRTLYLNGTRDNQDVYDRLKEIEQMNWSQYKKDTE